jgi:putative ABC transport system permease protein
VVKNFHFRPLQYEIQPFVFGLNPDWNNFIFARLSTDNISGAVKHMENVFDQFNPDYPFVYNFMNDRLDRMYASERRMGKMVEYFADLAILISCLGLFGLASFMAEKRTKEIGIRKTLGASVPGLIFLLSKEFSKWVLAANIIAWPLAYLAAKNWLQGFAYRIGLSPWIFILSGVLALAVALLTVSYQSVKAALANPVESLRYE